MTKHNDTPDDMPDDIRDRMPDPSQPTMGIKPDEALRFLGAITEGQAIAALLLAAACHGMTQAADDDEQTDDDLREHLKAAAALISMAGKITCKAGKDVETAMRSTAKAFAAVGLKLDPKVHTAEEIAEATGDGEALQKRTNAFLRKPNGLAAGVICRTDHPGARDLADRAGLDPDEIADRPVFLDVDAGKLKTPADQKPTQAKPTPPTWTGRNGAKWKPDGTRDDGATPNN